MTSGIRGALLHFKFLGGFADYTKEQVVKNRDVAEKGLSEKAVYLAALAENPDLSLMDKNSQKYTGPEQLLKLGWMRSQKNYDAFAARRKRKASKPIPAP